MNCVNDKKDMNWNGKKDVNLNMIMIIIVKYE